MWWYILKQPEEESEEKPEEYQYQGQPVVLVYPREKGEDAKIFTLAELGKTSNDVPPELRHLIGENQAATQAHRAGSSDAIRKPALGYYKHADVFFDQGNPNHRAMYNFLPNAMFDLHGGKSDWLIYPKELTEETKPASSIGVPITNWDGLLFIMSKEDHCWLFDLNWEAAAHRAAAGGICVYRRGKILPFEQYKLEKPQAQQKIKREPRKRPTSRLLEGLTRAPRQGIERDKPVSQENKIRHQAKVIYDFISDYTIVNTGPSFPGTENNNLPRIAKVCLMMGRPGSSDRICVGGRDDHRAQGQPEPQYEIRGDAIATGLMGYSQPEDMLRRFVQNPGAALAHAPHHYPLEETMKKLEVQFPNWDPDNPQNVLTWFERNNYLLGPAPQLPGTY